MPGVLGIAPLTCRPLCAHVWAVCSEEEDKEEEEEEEEEEERMGVDPESPRATHLDTSGFHSAVKIDIPGFYESLRMCTTNH